MSASDLSPLLKRVTATQIALERASAAREQAIRDALAQHSTGDVAAALGGSEPVVDELLAEQSPPAARPELEAVVFLRGAGAPAQTWRLLEGAIHARGLITIRDRTKAWHLARGGAPVVLVDFSAGGPGLIGRVRARWRVTQSTRPVAELLPRSERERLAAAEWLNTPVDTEERDPELPLIDPDQAVRFDLADIDPDRIGRAVVEQLHAAKNTHNTK